VNKINQLSLQKEAKLIQEIETHKSSLEKSQEKDLISGQKIAGLEDENKKLK
jgi:hypothetical protein